MSVFTANICTSGGRKRSTGSRQRSEETARIFELIISGVVTGALSLRKKCAVVPFRSRQATGAVLMAVSAKGIQVQIVIASLPAAQLLVVDLQVLSGTTDLAFPAIPTQYLFPEVFVELGIKLQTRSLGSNSGFVC